MSQSLRAYQSILPQVSPSAFVDPSSVVIGEVTLAEDVSVWPLVAIRGDVNFISVGARTNIQDGTIIHVTHKTAGNPAGFPTIIGKDVTIGHKAMLHGCTIGNRVLVGMSSTILDGAIVEDDVIIGAGSLVSPGKRLASGYLYFGSPARQIRPLTQEEREGLLYSANNYVKWKNDYLEDASIQIQPDAS